MATLLLSYGAPHLLRRSGEMRTPLILHSRRLLSLVPEAAAAACAGGRNGERCWDERSSSRDEGGLQKRKLPLREHSVHRQMAPRRLLIRKPYYHKLIFSSWIFVHFYPEECDTNFEEHQHKKGLRYYLCNVKDCQYISDRRSYLNDHFKNIHNKEYSKDQIRRSSVCQWNVRRLNKNEIKLESLTRDTLLSWEASDTQKRKETKESSTRASPSKAIADGGSVVHELLTKANDEIVRPTSRRKKKAHKERDIAIVDQ